MNNNRQTIWLFMNLFKVARRMAINRWLIRVVCLWLHWKVKWHIRKGFLNIYIFGGELETQIIRITWFVWLRLK